MDKRYRRAIIAGNWKMNKSPSEVKPFLDELKPLTENGRGAETVLCVPFVCLPALIKAARGSHISAGAQDVSEHTSGAYTGEISAGMLRDLGLRCCIVGHSERRSYHGESNTAVNKKLLALLEQGIAPILCVGESLEQREAGLTPEHIGYQVKAALQHVPEEEIRRVIIAYEPVWAIGTGRTATAEQAEEVCAHIRAVLRQLYGARRARGVSILYGGSMNAKNAAELLAQPDIDGGLIGGASLKPADFAAIVKEAQNEQ